MVSSVRTLVDLLRLRATAQSGQHGYTFLDKNGDEAEVFTYPELHLKARAIAAVLQQHGAEGQPVLLLFPPGLEFVAAFFGCLYARALAVPAYPPRPNRFGSRLEAICADTGSTIALATSKIVSSRASIATMEMSALRWIATDSIDDGEADHWRDPNAGEDTVAFLQYTSGSTLTPKGVMVTHANLLYNERMIETAFEHTNSSIVVGWLPLYHDMGLIGNVLQPLWMGIPCILMSPVDFLLKPARWLKAITHYRGTTGGAPDFAYDLCVRKVTPEERATLDLSTWDLAYCGAEPVRPKTIERFSRTFAECGFRREAFYPCYGLAEATLFVSGGKKGAAPIVVESHSRSTDVSGGLTVACGTSKLEEQVLIVDPESLTECPLGALGEIWVAGPNVASGYWNRAQETEETFGARLPSHGEQKFLRTGDLGFIRDGELCIQGRIKDMMIIRGINHYPQDIEQSVEDSHAALRPRSAAAFSVDIDGQENLVIVQEVARDFRDLDCDEIIRDVRQAIAERHGLQVYGVVLIKAGTIPQTSSGKIQRFECRRLYLDGKLEIVGGHRVVSDAISGVSA